ncbi:hypothetical protein MPH_10416 [Macrophomina phaseolina MS6]|uniref:Uncharacterized protein n=1 Tax=Macrophomina phaseolina (strain MS6) TaxID=1126212 RepID=K2RQJ2_MACPH|nr:hypothetical protein MPH_10416 [Macrophomina phaseolina MS6]
MRPLFLDSETRLLRSARQREFSIHLLDPCCLVRTTRSAPLRPGKRIQLTETVVRLNTSTARPAERSTGCNCRRDKQHCPSDHKAPAAPTSSGTPRHGLCQSFNPPSKSLHQPPSRRSKKPLPLLCGIPEKHTIAKKKKPRLPLLSHLVPVSKNSLVDAQSPIDATPAPFHWSTTGIAVGRQRKIDVRQQEHRQCAKSSRSSTPAATTAPSASRCASPFAPVAASASASPSSTSASARSVPAVSAPRDGCWIPEQRQR